MKLKNILIVVKDIEKSKQFYHDLFGLSMVQDCEGNAILTEGLVLQEEKLWKTCLEKDILTKSNAFELYFEESDMEAFVQKLEKLYPRVEYVTPLMTYAWGQEVLRFYDLDGNLIEVRGMEKENTTCNNYNIQPAREHQKEEILALYRTMAGGAADWNEYYPSMSNIEFDMERDNLFVMMEEDAIIATISIDEDDEVKQLPIWSKELEPAGELSRLCVRQDRQNQGIARVMMEFAFEKLKERGYKGVHILVREGHKIALQSYSHLGYEPVGRCSMFEREFCCFERLL